jgi:hypothetical protein
MEFFTDLERDFFIIRGYGSERKDGEINSVDTYLDWQWILNWMV